MNQIARDKRAVLRVLELKGPCTEDTIRLCAGEFDSLYAVLESLIDEAKIEMDYNDYSQRVIYQII